MLSVIKQTPFVPCPLIVNVDLTPPCSNHSRLARAGTGRQIDLSVGSVTVSDIHVDNRSDL